MKVVVVLVVVLVAAMIIIMVEDVYDDQHAPSGHGLELDDDDDDDDDQKEKVVQWRKDLRRLWKCSATLSHLALHSKWRDQEGV